MNLRLFQLIKMTIGFMIGMLLGMLFRLPYFFTAGVIVVLSLEPTRKESTRLSIIRVIDSLISLGLSVLLFYIFGFHIWVLFVFVLLFIPISFLFTLEKGIVVSLVLISQIYLEKDLMFSLNALYILLIGVGVALLLNLYMPKFKTIEKEIDKLNSLISDLFEQLSKGQIPSFDEVDLHLANIYTNIKLEMENVNLPLTTQRLKYIEVRLEQINILKRVCVILNDIKPIPEKTKILEFLGSFVNKIGLDDFASPLLDELDELFNFFKKSDLPETREQFENRAQLYYVLIEINQFLNVKKIYHQNIELSEGEVK